MNIVKHMRFALPFILYAFIFILLWRGLHLHPEQIPSALINKPAPQFSLPALFDPNKMISNQDLLGQVVLVNIWASWCVVCANEHASLVQLAKNEHVHFFGINYKDDISNAKRWLLEYGNPYQM